jgi:hypothetical protein
MAINLNPVGITNPDTVIQQNINNITGSLVSSATKNIRNPVLAGAAQSLLGSILSNNQNNSGQFQAPSPKTSQSVSNISNMFTQLDLNNEFAKTCRFLVNLPIPKCMTTLSGTGYNYSSYFDMRYACNMAELPGINHNPIEYRHYAFTQRLSHFPTFTPITLSLYCFGDMMGRNFFEWWMNYLINFQTGLVGYPQDKNGPVTTTDITITQYTVDGTPSYITTLFGAFPIAIAPQPLNWADDRIHELQVTFHYNKWRTYITDLNNPSPEAYLPSYDFGSSAVPSPTSVQSVPPPSPAPAASTQNSNESTTPINPITGKPFTPLTDEESASASGLPI